jgi:hypothetical protein
VDLSIARKHLIGCPGFFLPLTDSKLRKRNEFERGHSDKLKIVLNKFTSTGYRFCKRVLATQQNLINARADPSILTQNTQAHINQNNCNNWIDINSRQMNNKLQY